MRIARVLILLICISGSEANADPITFSFSVRVTGVDDPTGRLLGQTVAPGDILRGTYTFDSHAVSQVDSSFFGLYSSSGAPYGFKLGNIVSDELRIDVFNFDSGDHYNVLPGGWGTTTPDFVPGALELMFSGPPDTFASVALPLVPPDVNQLTFRSFRIDAYNPLNPVNGGFIVTGNVVSLEAVPEPTTLTLLTIGLAGGALARRRRL
jgi:hypothetical protein